MLTTSTSTPYSTAMRLVVLVLGISLFILAAFFFALATAANTGYASHPNPNSASGIAAGGTQTPPSCPLEWQVVASPNSGVSRSQLRKIDALSPTDAWAVGSSYNPTLARDETLIVHWDGSQWTIIPSPNAGAGTEDNILFGVTAIATDDVWAVGNYDDVGQDSRTLVMHWDGINWEIIASPNPGNYSSALYGVDAIAQNDIWAVGTVATDTELHTLVLHWDGSSWSQVASPSPGYINSLSDVSAAGPNDVWAVGEYLSSGPGIHNMIQHWDGTAWSVVTTPEPTPSTDHHGLVTVTALSANDAWAAGYYYDGNMRSYFLHWNGSAWSHVTSPLIATQHIYINDLSAVASNDVWAVGYLAGPSETLIMRWNGTAWSRVDSPNPDDENNELYGIAITSSNDMWAVGSSGFPVQTTVLRYDYDCAFLTPTATATPEPECRLLAQVVGHPGPTGYSNLLGADARNQNDIWAVGFQDSSSGEQTLVEHWDGSAWSVVPSPNVPGAEQNMLQDVVAISENDVWAVGFFTLIDPQVRQQNLVMRWNGVQWSIVSTPDIEPQSDYLLGIDAITATDIWAVGYYIDAQYAEKPLTMRWDGTGWTQVATPNMPCCYKRLSDVAAVASDDVWAVGLDGQTEAFTLHWDGTQWNIVPLPTIDTPQLFAVAAHNGEVWAAGSQGFNTEVEPLLIEWDGSAWQVRPSENPDTEETFLFGIDITDEGVWAVGYYNEPNNGSRRTLILHDGEIVPSRNVGSGNMLWDITALSDEAWAVGGFANGALIEHVAPSCNPACQLGFEDVIPASPFYPFVHCLACWEIIGGYPCGGPGEPCVPPDNLSYFRPSNRVTRAQISKIVSLAAAFAEPVSGQTFQDVLPGSTFYPYIERLAARGIMQGYPCGSPGEPCVPPANLPYFRPDHNATRGQLAKIVANAAGINEPASTQTFEDVPPGSTFWWPIENLVEREVMQGYPCGNPDPCVPPLNRPYFRPGDHVTRGQTSKITSNTFFPNCALR